MIVQPPAGTWLTSGLSTYRTSGGALGVFAGLTSKGRACDCSKPLQVGQATYCTFAGAATPNIVAQCARQP